jgi:hypothetical protein
VEAMQLSPNRAAYKSKVEGGFKRSEKRLVLGLILCVIAFAFVMADRPLLAYSTQTQSTQVAAVDPNKGPSELNHHVAGWALIGVGLLVLTSFLSPRPERHRFLWPALFVLAGFYLALWSDGEIWPRGNLNWLWLLHHDAEARQHKIYAILLVAIGAIEYIRLRGSLPRFWKTWAFPLLAVIGAGMLMFHDHTGGSGARSPEAQAYLVNPALDVDGRPPKASSATEDADAAHDLHHPMQASSESDSKTAPVDRGAMSMDHSQMTMSVVTGDSIPASHHHVMTESMLRVEHQHMWFLAVGLAIGLFKFISDGEFFRNRIVPCMWPTCMLLLGFMLVLYRE